jgi:Flp pilus assembly protein TadG
MNRRTVASFPIQVRQLVRGRWRRLLAGRDVGSSTVELCLATTLLVMLFMFVVLCGRLTSAQLDVNAAASAAARAASLARTDTAARLAADQTARDTLAGRAVVCKSVTVTVDTGGLRPGGAVVVTVACRVGLADLALIRVPGARTLQATGRAPVDLWRGSS